MVKLWSQNTTDHCNYPKSDPFLFVDTHSASQLQNPKGGNHNFCVGSTALVARMHWHIVSKSRLMRRHGDHGDVGPWPGRSWRTPNWFVTDKVNMGPLWDHHPATDNLQQTKKGNDFKVPSFEKHPCGIDWNCTIGDARNQWRSRIIAYHEASGSLMIINHRSPSWPLPEASLSLTIINHYLTVNS